MSLPEDFCWGTVSASTSSEGAAPASDWMAWERAGRAPRSGTGNDFSTRFRDDFALLADHGVRSHRMTLEWARLEPHEGARDLEAVEHLREVLRAARDVGVAVWAGLHHISLPGWFSVDEGGFVDARSRRYFWARHVDFVAETFGDLVAGWVPVHEPAAYALGGWMGRGFPPGRHDPAAFREALEATHLAAFEAARRLRGGGPPVASAFDLAPVRAVGDDPMASSWARTADEVLWGWVAAVRDGILQVPDRGPVEEPEFRDAFDVLGFTYDSAVGIDGTGSFVPYPAGMARTATGSTSWPEGLGEVLHRLADELPDRPLMVLGYGVGTADDDLRVEHLRRGAAEVGAAIGDGIDVRGFFHRTGIDGYEWRYGFEVPFGLFDGDRAPRPSAALMRELAGR